MKIFAKVDIFSNNRCSFWPENELPCNELPVSVLMFEYCRVKPEKGLMVLTW
jgi:hypothetical protein